MVNRIILFTVVCLCFLACTTDEQELQLETLQDYIEVNSNLDLDEVIACAASKKENVNTSFVFYYPIPSATDIKYFETSSIDIDKDNYSLYKEKNLEKEDVFNGYLGRFVRNSTEDVWCIVTYKSSGKFHKSNPIRLKSQSNPTEWTDKVTIDESESLAPKFLWDDGIVKENRIYFQVITNVDNNLLSGTYTYDKWFQYYNLANVVLNVTRESPPSLQLMNDYNFTLMGVSEDNWVNLVIQKTFVAK